MRFALEVWSARFEEVEATCRTAERLGIDAFYYGESPHQLNLDCWTTLAALARSTRHVRLGPVITNVLPAYRSAALLAKQAATVAAVSNGRLDFRTGVGAAAGYGRAWWEPFGVEYPAYDRRLADLRDALGLLRSTWAADAAADPGGASDGRSTPLAPATPTIPVTVAARGERAMELAARFGDVWETSFCTPTEFAARKVRMVDLLAGRRITTSLEIDGFVATTRAGLDRLVGRVRAERGVHEDVDAVLQRAVVGVPEDAVGRLVELAEAGVDQVVVALHDPHDRDALEAIAETARIARGGSP